MTAQTVALIIVIVGLALLAGGAAWIYPPAGLIVLGVGLIVSGLLWDVGDR